MQDWIERYVYDVARRLPEKDREEVKKELRANITDMLPEDADEEAIKQVLQTLGAPGALAESYRQKPRYLISPAFFDDYVRALKWILPLVGVLLFCIGAAIGISDAVGDASAGVIGAIAAAFAKGLEMGISAAFQALVWTTAGFAVVDYFTRKEGGAARGWRVEELPELEVSEKARIPLSDSIVSIVVTLVFSVIGVLFCAGRIPFALIFANAGLHVTQIFAEAFLKSLIPVIVIGAVLQTAEAIAKIKDRRWSPMVSGLVVLRSVASMVLSILVLTRGQVLSDSFLAFLATTPVAGLFSLRAAGLGGINLLLLGFCVLLVIGAIAESATAIANAVRFRKQTQTK